MKRFQEKREVKSRAVVAQMWSSLLATPFEFVDFSSQVIVEQALIEEYNEFNGRIEYYGVHNHGSLRMRRADGVKPDRAVLVDLLVGRPKLEKESVIQLQCHNWTPTSKA